MIGSPYFWLALALYGLSAFAYGQHIHALADEAERNKQALQASQEATNAAHRTTEILGTLVNKPDLASDSVVADRLCQPENHSGVSGAAVSVPASPRTSNPERVNQGLAREIKQCIQTVDRYSALRDTWLANQAK